MYSYTFFGIDLRQGRYVHFDAKFTSRRDAQPIASAPRRGKFANAVVPFITLRVLDRKFLTSPSSLLASNSRFCSAPRVINHIHVDASSEILRDTSTRNSEDAARCYFLLKGAKDLWRVRDKIADAASGPRTRSRARQRSPSAGERARDHSFWGGGGRNVAAASSSSSSSTSTSSSASHLARRHVCSWFAPFPGPSFRPVSRRCDNKVTERVAEFTGNWSFARQIVDGLPSSRMTNFLIVLVVRG